VADDAQESTVTVLVAGAANLAIAIAKIVAGVVTGSSAMLAEAAHSCADTLNQAFLLTALRRSRKPADTRHPFGYGMERYFWSLLAAVGIFVLGAGFSILQGVESIIAASPVDSLMIAYIVLGVSFVFEGVSWLRAVHQVRSDSGQLNDPAVKTVLFEDTAALIGIVLAAVGVTLHHLTDQAFWDGAASIAIGLLLVGVAYALGRENKTALMGQSVDKDMREAIRAEIETSPGIDTVVELMTMRMGPTDVLVAVRADIADDESGEAIEHYADEVDRRLRNKFAEIRHVFIDPTDPASVDPAVAPKG
jgi:cation diffusion facilitator family transporter